VIYISHTYLVVEATYLKFLNNRALELGIYVVVLIAFSYMVEVFLYDIIRKKLIK
jgi:hypothetical protein